MINYKLLLNPNPNLALTNCLWDLLTANVTHFIGMLCIHLYMMYFECVLIKFLGYRSFFGALKIHHIISFYKQIFSGTQEARKNTKQKQNQTKEEKLKPLYHISNIWFLDRIKTELNPECPGGDGSNDTSHSPNGLKTPDVSSAVRFSFYSIQKSNIGYVV